MSKKKKVFRPHMLISQCVISMSPLLGPLKPTALLKPMSPVVIVPPCPPISVARRVARNSQWGGCFGSLGGGAPSRRRHGGLGRSPKRSKILRFFAKITKFYGYFDRKIMLLKRGLEIGSASMIKLVA